MAGLLPEEILWHKDKVGFETPQKEWMADLRMQEMIHEARKKLVNENILRKDILETPVMPTESYTAFNNDWKYLTAAFVL